MIDKWLITGDCHGNFSKFTWLDKTENAGIIILGDACVNYFIEGWRDYKSKKQLKTHAEKGYTFFLVHGNHEEDPAQMPSMQKVFNEDVKGFVYEEAQFPWIKYLIDGEVYLINGKTALVLGGAYSVDKFYRLQLGYSWFPHEQMSEEQKTEIFKDIKGCHFDMILSHTCPISWEPTDLFLPGIDQSTIDKSMENWLEEVKNSIDFNAWFFGHYHADRFEDLNAFQFFNHLSSLDEIYELCKNKTIPWGYLKAPKLK